MERIRNKQKAAAFLELKDYFVGVSPPKGNLIRATRPLHMYTEFTEYTVLGYLLSDLASPSNGE